MAAPLDELEHLLRRTGFIARPADLARLDGLDWEAAVDAVLDVSAAEPADAGKPTIAHKPAPTTDWSGDYTAMCHWWFERCITTATPIVEKMLLFWHGHLTTSCASVPLGLVLDQHVRYRELALGSYVDLVQAASVDPGMLLYLDNKSNHRWNPNENFARELLELFTLGIGHYSQDDVRAAARAWTGHRVDEDGNWDHEFHQPWHDETDKTFMGVTRNWDGPEIVDHVLTGPTQTVAARHLVRKLWAFFAYPDPEDALVDDLAAVFVGAGLQVVPLLRALLLRPEFRSVRARQERLRSPIELVVAAMAHTGLTPAQINPQWDVGAMGQSAFMPPNVDGWVSNAGWIATSTMWARHEFAERVGWELNGSTVLDGVEELPVDDAVQAALDLFGIRDASGVTWSRLRQLVTSVRAAQPWHEKWALIVTTMQTPEFALA